MTTQSENGQLLTKTVQDLQNIAKAIGIDSGGMGKEQLISAIAGSSGNPDPDRSEAPPPARGGRQQAPPAPVPPLSRAEKDNRRPHPGHGHREVIGKLSTQFRIPRQRTAEFFCPW